MQSSMLITHNDCTYSWAVLLPRALLHSPAQWGRRAGGRRMVRLIGRTFHQSDASSETRVHNEACHSENVGERCGICDSSVKHPLHHSVSLSVWQSWIYSRQTERRSSVLMKAYLPETENTQPTHAEETCHWLTRHTNQVHLITGKAKGYKG